MTTIKEQYQVLLYYNYVDISDEDLTCYEHLAFCKALGLLGRIYISSEGINGTCAGTREQIKKYQRYMKKHPLFQDTEFKCENSDFLPFRKMFVRTRPEIVASDLFDEVSPNKDTGTHLSPGKFHDMLQNDPDVVAFDARNDYEWKIGTFEGAVTPDIANFRELKNKVDNGEYDYLKEKKLLMFCTGGIRCEKASAYFKKKGFSDVYQLDGGIIKYGQTIKEEDRLYKGKCFVFDDRLATPITQDVLTTCEHCDTSCDRYLNCTNLQCNKLFLCCEACKESKGHACTTECALHPRERWYREDVSIHT